MKHLLPFLLAALPLFLAAADFKLADNGTPLVSIVLPAEPLPEETEAANILKEHLDKITGGDFKIVTGGKTDGPQIRIGGRDTLPDELKKALKLDDASILRGDPRDQLSIRAVRGPVMYLCGRSPEATVYAVNHLLHALGVRYFSYCKAFIIIPRKPTLSAPAEDFSAAPAFTTRNIYGYTGYDKDDDVKKDIFLKRNGFNDDLKGLSGHNFKGIWPREKYPELFPAVKPEDAVQVQVDINFGKDAEALAKKQEALEKQAKEQAVVQKKEHMQKQLEAIEELTALTDITEDADVTEKRETTIRKTSGPAMYQTTQVCVSNPLAWKVGLEWAENTIKQHPEYDMVTYGINDGGGGDCMCPNCKALGNNLDRYIFLANKIGETFLKNHPDKFIHIWAYANTAQVPTRKADGYDNGTDRILITAYTQSIRMPMPRLIEGLGSATHYIREADTWYFFHEKHGPKFHPFRYAFPRLQNDMRHRAKHGVRMISALCPVDGVRNGFNLYVYSRILWDLDVDVESLRLDYAEKCFPSARNEFYNLDSLVNSFVYGKFTKNQYNALAGNLLLRILEKVRNDPDQLFRWQTYAAWYALQIYQEQIGWRGDQGRPQKEVLENNRKFMAAIKAQKFLDAVEVGARLLNHRRIISEWVDPDIVRNTPDETENEIDFSVEGLEKNIREYLDGKELPYPYWEDLPFPE